jgi:hypothetical protein
MRYIILFMLISASYSCKKGFVDLTPQGLIPVNGYYQDELSFKNALTGMYNSLRTIYNNNWAYSELPSDNTITFPESEAFWGEMDKFTWLPTSTRIQEAWSRHYTTIALCNIVLDRITPVSMPQANKDRYIAEAKFVRALMYFNLVRMFGDVPLVLNEITTEAQAYSYNRESMAKVYAQIEKDLTESAAVLPASYTAADIGRATKTAANGLLGKVYMFQKKFPQAESILATVVATAPSPLTSYNRIFGLGNDNNPEIIFSIQYISGGFGEGNIFSRESVPQPSGTTIIGVSGSSYNVGGADLNTAFESNDLRKPISIDNFTNGALVYYYTRKFLYPTVLAGNEGDTDWPVLRFGDVILLYAEALNENNKTNEALIQLNRIRTRAGLPDKSGLSQQDARTAIYNERRVELCFEGERWFDLVRWDIFIPTMQAFKTKYNVTGMGKIEERLKVFPIPTRRVLTI